MKIKMNDQAHSTTFGAISKGEIFIWDDSVLLKVEENGHYGELYNSVELETGDHYTFSEFDRVTRPTSYEFSVNY